MGDIQAPDKTAQSAGSGAAAPVAAPAKGDGIRQQLRGMPYQQQVEALKPPPDATQKPATQTPAPEKKEAAAAVDLKTLAESLVDAKGTAGAGDKAAVVKEVMKIPRGGLEKLVAKKTRITVCKNSVTEILTSLKGVQPRGWPPGMTWDSVPGLYDPATNQVIVATRKGVVPPTGDGHGSANLVIHEVGHAIDAAGGGSDAPEFVAAYNKDKATLPAYEQQAGKAGREEAYAESMARNYGGDTSGTGANLAKYWKTDPLGAKK